MNTKKEQEHMMAQVKEFVRKKVKTFTKEYIDGLSDEEIITIPLVAFENKKQINLGRVELGGKEVKEIYYNKEISAKATAYSEVKTHEELYTERPEKIDDNAIVLKKRTSDTHLN